MHREIPCIDEIQKVLTLRSRKMSGTRMLCLPDMFEFLFSFFNYRGWVCTRDELIDCRQNAASAFCLGWSFIWHMFHHVSQIHIQCQWNTECKEGTKTNAVKLKVFHAPRTFWPKQLLCVFWLIECLCLSAGYSIATSTITSVLE